MNLKVIEDAITRLGPLITLELAALDLELALKEYEAALQRLDAIIENAPRKETYLVRKAEVFERMGDKLRSRECYNQALTAIAALPERQQKLKSIKDLKAEIDRRIKGHSAVPPA